MKRVLIFTSLQFFLLLRLSAQLVLQPGTSITVGNGAKLETTGMLTLTLQSTSSGTASFVDQNVSGSTNVNISGGVYIQRFIGGWTDASHGWHFLSSPVVSQAISPQFVDITGAISANQDFYRWSEPFDTWVNIKNESGTYNRGSGELFFSNDSDPHFAVGKGYLVAYSSNVTKQFTGSLNLSDVMVSGLTYTTPAHMYIGWHLLGNPYPAGLEWNKTGGSWNLTNVDANCQIWNEADASYTILAPNGIIPAMNGFMIHTTSFPGSLTIPKTAQVHSETPWFKVTSADQEQIVLRVVDDAGHTAQTTIIRFLNDASNIHDPAYDSPFIPGFAPYFYSIGTDQQYALNTLPSLDKSTTIPLGFVKNGNSEFRIEMAENIPGQIVYLRDVKSGTDHRLNDGDYVFSSSDGDNSERFILHFGAVGIEEDVEQSKIRIWQEGDQIILESVNRFTDIALYDTQGRLMIQQGLISQDIQRIHAKLPSGIYLSRLCNSSGTQIVKLLIR